MPVSQLAEGIRLGEPAEALAGYTHPCLAPETRTHGRWQGGGATGLVFTTALFPCIQPVRRPATGNTGRPITRPRTSGQSRHSGIVTRARRARGLGAVDGKEAVSHATRAAIATSGGIRGVPPHTPVRVRPLIPAGMVSIGKPLSYGPPRRMALALATACQSQMDHCPRPTPRAPLRQTEHHGWQGGCRTNLAQRYGRRGQAFSDTQESSAGPFTPPPHMERADASPIDRPIGRAGCPSVALARRGEPW